MAFLRERHAEMPAAASRKRRTTNGGLTLRGTKTEFKFWLSDSWFVGMIDFRRNVQTSLFDLVSYAFPRLRHNEAAIVRGGASEKRRTGHVRFTGHA